MTGEILTPELQDRFRAPEAGVFLSQQRIARETAAGNWKGRVITDYLDRWVKERPDDLAFVDCRIEEGTETRLTYAELNRLVASIAGNLRDLGVVAGDVVSFQLPNWWQFVALHFACVRLGAVSNPLMPIFRARELKFMLTRGKTKVLVMPKRFAGYDYEPLSKELKAAVVGLEHVFLVDGDGGSFADALLKPCEGVAAGSNLKPNGIVQLLYTSGTTGEPKGALHTSNTLMASLLKMRARFHFNRDDVVFMPAPFGHQIGFCYGVMGACHLGAPLIAMDRWDVAKAADIMERYGATYSFAATPFLADLVYLKGLENYDLSRFRLFIVSGAPVPPALVEASYRKLKTVIVAGWGMTEVSFATATLPEQPAKAAQSDGVAFEGIEVRVLGSDGKPAAPGEEGELQCRGSTIFVGYLERPDLYAVDEDGWFETGDIARMDKDGYIRIAGRSKDIIIRGGENIPVVEVENLIHEMPNVIDVAVVGMPDPRLGERSCVFVTLQNGCSLTLPEVVAHLEKKELARQYMPERLEVLDAMPRTPSGKIQKFVLREQARTLVG